MGFLPMKNRVVWLALALLVLGSGATWLGVSHGHSSLSYTLAPLERGRIAEVVNATGVVRPREVYPVAAEIPGRVVAIAADFNQEVSEGDVLLRLDDCSAREQVRQANLATLAAAVAVRQAEAGHDAAERAARRERARSPQVRSQAELDLVEAQLRSAELAVEGARVRLRQAEESQRQANRVLEQTIVRAPTLPAPGGNENMRSLKATFTVLERKVSLNQITSPSAGELFVLAGNLEQMRVQAPVVEGDIHKVRPGLAVELTLPGEDERVIRGTVAEVRLTPVSERGAVYYPVIIDVVNERQPTGGWLLRPGLTATTDIIVRAHESAWKIPTAALQFRPDESTLSPAAQERRAKIPAGEGWQTVWMVGVDGAPWPTFVRVGAHDGKGEAGIQDSLFTEVLEWEAGGPLPGDAAQPAQVIVGAVPPKKNGWFTPPQIKF
jgi:HlyD family secretion protein